MYMKGIFYNLLTIIQKISILFFHLYGSRSNASLAELVEARFAVARFAETKPVETNLTALLPSTGSGSGSSLAEPVEVRLGEVL
jgi:hypothetical protein